MTSNGLPADIALLRFTWGRRASDAWTDEAFRAPVLVFLDQFLADHAWATEWEVLERFNDNGVNVRVPYGRTGPPVEDVAAFRQRTGDPLLVLTFTRERDSRSFEVSLHFPLGNDTPTQSVDRLLDAAKTSIETAERNS
jgi:hypothetical protein